MSSRQLLARRDFARLDEDVLGPLFRRDLLVGTEELVGEWGSGQISLGNVSENFAFCLLGLRNVAETSVQPVVAVRLNKSAPADPKPEVMRLDFTCRLLRPDQVKQQGVKALRCELHELAPELSGRLPAFTVRFGEVAADEATATVSVKSWAANDRMGRKIKTRSVIVAARVGSLDASFRSMFKRSTVSAVVYDVEAEVDEL